jgi:hypothetical protein
VAVSDIELVVVVEVGGGGDRARGFDALVLGGLNDGRRAGGDSWRVESISYEPMLT